MVEDSDCQHEFDPGRVEHTRSSREEFLGDVLGNHALAGDHGRRGFLKGVEVQPGVRVVEVEV